MLESWTEVCAHSEINSQLEAVGVKVVLTKHAISQGYLKERATAATIKQLTTSLPLCFPHHYMRAVETSFDT